MNLLKRAKANMKNDEQITTNETKPGPDNQEKTLKNIPKQKQLGKSKIELKKRAKIIAKAMMGGATAKDALISAGYSFDTASTQTTAVLDNPVVQETFQKILEKAGLSDDFLAAKLRSLVDAKEIKFFSEKGIVTDRREVEALSIQADMLKFAAKVKGHTKEETGAINNNINWSVNFNLVAKVEPDSKVIDLQPVDKQLST
jgi:hypothetical protein